MGHSIFLRSINLNQQSTSSSLPQRRRRRRQLGSHFFVGKGFTMTPLLLLLPLLIPTILAAERNERKHNDKKDPSVCPSLDDDDASGMTTKPWNPLYRVPDSWSTVGDRSDHYVLLRREMDTLFLPPQDGDQRSMEFMQSLRRQPLPATANENGSNTMMSYDLHNCPDEPPPDYPMQWKLVDEILTNWPVNEIIIDDSKWPVEQMYNGLCVFDYTRPGDIAKAHRYCDLELPFKMINDPRVARTVERWNHQNEAFGAEPFHFLKNVLQDEQEYIIEHNTNSHMMYHYDSPRDEEMKQWRDRHGRLYRLQRPDVLPTKGSMTFPQWLQKADNATLYPHNPEDDHWYFKLRSCGTCDNGTQTPAQEWLFDELPFFQPRPNDYESIYVQDVTQQGGVNCNFGMAGIIAESHFDRVTGALVVLHGSRRYILSHPDQCENLALMPNLHSTSRHSRVDYTQPDVQTFLEFKEARANEVILQAGDVLFLPSHWFHYIVSLEVNIQCQTRGGRFPKYADIIKDCGYPTAKQREEMEAQQKQKKQQKQ